MELSPLRLIRSGGQAAPSTHRSKRQRPLLEDVLRAHGLVDDAEIKSALEQSPNSGIRLGEALCANGILEPKGLVEALESQWGIRRLDLAATPPDARLISEIGPVTCLQDRCVPWRRIGAATVVVCEDPHQFEALREVYEARLGPIMLALAAPGDVGRAVARSHRHTLVKRAETRVPDAVSCRKWRSKPFRVGAAGGGVGMCLMASFALPALMIALLAIAVISLMAVVALKLAAAIAQARPEQDTAEIYDLHGAGAQDRLPMISILVPLYREEQIAAHLIRRLSELDYPLELLDVCLVVEQDDTITHSTLKTTTLPPWMRIVDVPTGSIKTKPRAMNYALDFCRGSIIGVYDAEDAPATDQLRKVAARFAQAGPKVACLQGSLDFYNTGHNWMSRCFTLEYASWFRVMLPGVARLGLVVPLGGTTLFFRRKVLERLGAWDAHNVTEDADLGVRLARAGYRTEFIDTVTEEEANSRPMSWVKQRSRWLKGYAMTYAVHMRDPIGLWQDLGAWRFFGFQIMFLGTLIQFTLAPLLWSMWVIPFSIAHPVQQVLPHGMLWAVGGIFICAELVNLAMTARALYRTQRLRLLPWVPTLSIYFMLATLAMYKALAEMLHRPFYWDKTQHGHFGGTSPEPQGQTPLSVTKAPDQSRRASVSESSRSRVSKALEI